jgi:hypothetical protein
MIDDIRKKRDKGTRKLDKFLEEKGYVIVEHDKTRKHDTITVKRLSEMDDPDAESVTTTISHRVSEAGSGGRLKMVLREIENLFSGRRRRGQGEFKLSSDGPHKEEWFGVIKGKRLSAIGIKALNTVMADGQERTMSVILSETKKWMQENRPESAQDYTPTRGQLSQYIRKRKDIKKEQKQRATFYRKV